MTTIQMPSAVKGIYKAAKNTVMQTPEIEIKVKEATSNEKWGPTGTQMREIAKATHSYHDLPIIMGTIWRRLNGHGKYWRHVYKSLLLIDYLLHHGSDQVVRECRDNMIQIQTLVEFQHIDENDKDVGLSVRERSKQIIELLHDDKRLKSEREKAQSNAKKYNVSMGNDRSGYGGYGNDSYGSDSYGSDSRDRDYGRDRDRDDDYGRDRDDRGSSSSRGGNRDRDYDDDDREYQDYKNKKESAKPSYESDDDKDSYVPPKAKTTPSSGNAGSAPKTTTGRPRAPSGDANSGSMGFGQTTQPAQPPRNIFDLDEPAKPSTNDDFFSNTSTSANSGFGNNTGFGNNSGFGINTGFGNNNNAFGTQQQTAPHHTSHVAFGGQTQQTGFANFGGQQQTGFNQPTQTTNTFSTFGNTPNPAPNNSAFDPRMNAVATAKPSNDTQWDSFQGASSSNAPTKQTTSANPVSPSTSNAEGLWGQHSGLFDFDKSKQNTTSTASSQPMGAIGTSMGSMGANSPVRTGSGVSAGPAIGSPQTGMGRGYGQPSGGMMGGPTMGGGMMGQSSMGMGGGMMGQNTMGGGMTGQSSMGMGGMSGGMGQPMMGGMMGQPMMGGGRGMMGQPTMGGGMMGQPMMGGGMMGQPQMGGGMMGQSSMGMGGGMMGQNTMGGGMMGQPMMGQPMMGQSSMGMGYSPMQQQNRPMGGGMGQQQQFGFK